MHLISVNVGKRDHIQRGAESVETGILKRPASAPVTIHTLGLEGDYIADSKHHGGEDQAVYVYTRPDYAWWESELGGDLEPGTFGENLTISGLESADLNIGDCITVGAVILQVTSPRIPCSVLAARMGDTGFVKRFKAAERPGVYCRVLQTGAVQAGDAVSLQPYDGTPYSVREMFQLHYASDVAADDLRRVLAAPIAIRDRESYGEKLAAIGG